METVCGLQTLKYLLSGSFQKTFSHLGHVEIFFQGKEQIGAFEFSHCEDRGINPSGHLQILKAICTSFEYATVIHLLSIQKNLQFLAWFGTRVGSVTGPAAVQLLSHLGHMTYQISWCLKHLWQRCCLESLASLNRRMTMHIFMIWDKSYANLCRQLLF